MARKKAKAPNDDSKVIIPEVVGKGSRKSDFDPADSENGEQRKRDIEIEVLDPESEQGELSEFHDGEAGLPDSEDEIVQDFATQKSPSGISDEESQTGLGAGLPTPVPHADDHSSTSDQGSGGIVPYDPLQAYLREIRGYPPLSREEEREIAIRYYTHKDLEAAYRLVTSNLWLVVKIAHDYEKAARGILDLIQEGNMGLMEAVKNFDPYRGVRFPSYAVWWIKAYIVRYLIANWRLVKIGTTQAQRKLFFNLKKEKEKLEREGFYPAPKLLAEKLNVKESEVVEMEQRLGSNDMSVDAPLPSDSESTMLALLPAAEESQEDLLDRKQVQKLIETSFGEFSKSLKPNELLIFRERMLGDDKATLQDIAEKLNLSRERIRQIENRLRDKLKDFLEAKYGPEVKSILKESLDL